MRLADVELLAADRQWGKRAAAAREPAATPAILTKLAADEHRLVRKAVASNPLTPEEVLALLAHDEYLDVRLAVARNESAPERIGSELFDRDPQCREAVLANLKGRLGRLHTDAAECPISSVELMRRHDSAVSVPPTVASTEPDQEPLAFDPDDDVRAALARHGDLTMKVAALLAADEVSAVRRAVAENPHTPDRILGFLSTDPDVDVRRCVAGHSGTPRAVLKSLLDDPDAGVRDGAIERLRGNR
jgi:hypothetical protein